MKSSDFVNPIPQQSTTDIRIAKVVSAELVAIFDKQYAKLTDEQGTEILIHKTDLFFASDLVGKFSRLLDNPKSPEFKP